MRKTGDLTTVGPVQLELVPGWEDVSGDLDQSAPPFTLSCSEGEGEGGTGVLQLSPAVFSRGTAPNATLEHLRRLCVDFGKRKGLEPGASPSSYEDPVRLWYGMSYRIKGRFVRVWYASDRMSFVLATYLPLGGEATDSECAAGIADCERMLSTIAFLR